MNETSGAKAQVQLRRGADARAGPDRMRLLRAIRDLGSISAAAKAEGLSYKGAWDAVQALNNLFAQPLVSAQPGGARGGTAQVTAAGVAVLAAYASVEGDLATVDPGPAALMPDGVSGLAGPDGGGGPVPLDDAPVTSAA